MNNDITQTTCKHCGQHIEHPVSQNGSTVDCPNCKWEVRLGGDPVSYANKPEPTQLVLEEVRSQTAYPELRNVINLAFYALVVLVVLGMGVVPLMTALKTNASMDTGGWIMFFLSLLAAAVIIVFGKAARQAALLLVDIADIQLQQRRARG